jgi:hypothetical protein
MARQQIAENLGYRERPVTSVAGRFVFEGGNWKGTEKIAERDAERDADAK